MQQHKSKDYLSFFETIVLLIRSSSQRFAYYQNVMHYSDYRDM